jgi:Ca2+-binding EF-hand superfamily protein
MKSIAILAAAGLSAAAFAVVAAPEGHGDRLKAADTNGDGMISREEAKALPRLAKHFDEIDTNKDGQISADELRARHDKTRGEHWKKLDTNGDGKISKAEAQANAPRLFEHFDQIDANKDGFVTPEEMKAAHQGRRGSK